MAKQLASSWQGDSQSNAGGSKGVPGQVAVDVLVVAQFFSGISQGAIEMRIFNHAKHVTTFQLLRQQ